MPTIDELRAPVRPRLRGEDRVPAASRVRAEHRGEQGEHGGARRRRCCRRCAPPRRSPSPRSRRRTDDDGQQAGNGAGERRPPREAMPSPRGHEGPRSDAAGGPRRSGARCSELNARTVTPTAGWRRRTGRRPPGPRPAGRRRQPCRQQQGGVEQDLPAGATVQHPQRGDARGGPEEQHGPPPFGRVIHRAPPRSGRSPGGQKKRPGACWPCGQSGSESVNCTHIGN